jgi:hypothetical protein
MKARLVFRKKEVYVDGSLVEIRIWQVAASSTFPNGIKYAFYFIGPAPEREVLLGYDNHHGKGHHRHERGKETSVTVASVSALLQRFRHEVAERLRKQGVILLRGSR